MKKDHHIIIIGAGASGLMLASLLEDKANMLLIDSNPKIGAKIAISGGGKCNLTNKNVNADNYLGVDWFVQSVLNRFDQNEVLAWFGDRGVELEIRKNNQYFCKRSSNEVLEIFRRELSGADMLLNTKVQEVIKKDGLFSIKTDRSLLLAEHLVIASGGLSFVKTGASSIGLEIAEEFGHRISRLSPALVGLTLQPEQFFFKELSGVSLPVVITVEEKSFDDDLLFTHKGISGPAVLNASLYWKKGKIEINFLPGFDRGSLRGKKQLSTILPLPKKAAKAFLKHLNIVDKAAEKLTDSERVRIKSLQQYSFAPAGTFGYTKAEVTRGGVDTAEIDPYTMMSLKEDKLYFVGEILDVTGELGGYNFQWAFSSAYACAQGLVDA